MKTLSQLRNKTTTKKINGTVVAFKNVSNGVAVTIDGEVLDVYPNINQAEKMATEFLKQLKVYK